MFQLNNFTVRTKLTTMAVLFFAGMSTYGAVSYSALSAVEIGSPAYNSIITSKQIGSDFAPAPASIMPAYFVLFRMISNRNPSDLPRLIALFDTAEKNFETAKQYWLAHVEDAEMKRLVEKSFEGTAEFFELVRTKMIPLVEAGKYEEANQLRHDKTLPIFEANAKAIDDLLHEADRRVHAAEASAAGAIRWRLAMMIGVLLSCLIGGATSSLWVANEISSRLRNKVSFLERVAEGDLSQRPDDHARDEIGQLSAALDRMIDSLSAVVAQIRGNSETLHGQAEQFFSITEQAGALIVQTSTQASTASAAAEQVSQNVGTVSTATEQMTSSIKEIAKNATTAAEVAGSAAQLADATNRTMVKLSESSAEIGNVVKVITSIAEQTNLLALNATIEAARAGEAGKGFAVVANEVKELAKETAKATEDISRKVEAIQNDAKGAVGAIDEITTVIGRINDIQNTIASSVEEQTAATNEIARNIAETSKGSSEIASNITGVAQAAQENQKTATALHNSAGGLTKMAEGLNELVSHFTLATNGANGSGPRRHSGSHAAAA